MQKILTFPSKKELTTAAADLFVEMFSDAAEQRGKFSVALSGGSTPKALYELLASDRYRKRLDASKMIVAIGDERNVPFADERSNHRMAAKAFLSPLDIPDKNVVFWDTSLARAEDVVKAFEASLKAAFEIDDGEIPRFDLILLGLGTDGHTASLFPHTKALADRGLASANVVPQLGETRFTITFPVINNAKDIVFLVAGSDKADAVRYALQVTAMQRIFLRKMSRRSMETRYGCWMTMRQQN